MGGRKQGFKLTKPGIHIIGEGITEQYYFTHLKNIFNFTCTIRPRFFCNTSIKDIGNRIKELQKGDITVICIFDADVSKRNEKENERLKVLQIKYSKNKNVIFCDSLPSIEYWFLIHFKDTCPDFLNSKQVEKQLKKFITDYDKTEAFLKNEKWVRDMSLINGTLQIACQRAKSYTSKKLSYSNIYKGIDALMS